MRVTVRGLSGYACRICALLLLIGYLLVRREDSSLLSLGLYVFAIGLRLFMVDGEGGKVRTTLRSPRRRLMLASCALLGWVLGIMGPFADGVTSRLFAFLAGGVLISSVHAEMRAEESSRFGWFVGGSAAYSCILMLI